MKILSYPRDPNPYQQLLYDACSGVQVRYVGELTKSATISLLLMPVELLVGRLTGWRILHLHWMFRFRLPGDGVVPFVRLIGSLYFTFVLATARVLGIHIAWTAHNVLPHEPVFHDDVKMRRLLVRASDLVICHSDDARARLERVVGPLRNARVIPHGPFTLDTTRPADPPRGPIRVLFFGVVARYKGVEDLLRAVARLPAGSPIRVTVAGACTDDELRAELETLVTALGDRAQLRLERIPDAELPELFAAHDAMVFPFREVTTSGSVLLGLGSGKAVVVPDLPVFDDVPALRFTPGIDGLTARLAALAHTDRAELFRIGAAGRAWATETSWEDVGEATVRAFQEIEEQPR